MIFFFAPFIWMMAVPVLIVGDPPDPHAISGCARWGPHSTRAPNRKDQPFIEGEFIDDEKPDNPEEGSTLRAIRLKNSPENGIILLQTLQNVAFSPNVSERVRGIRS